MAMNIDTPKGKVIKALKKLGYELVREREHLNFKNAQGTPLSIPNHKKIKGSTLSTVMVRAGIDKGEFFALCRKG